MARLLLLLLLYFLQNPWNEAHSYSSLQNVSPIFNFSFSYTSTNELIKDVYEPGHLIANANLCPNLGKNMKLMILVTSALDHMDARLAIRQTWSLNSLHHNVSVGFIVGTYKEPSKNATIETEQHTYGDLIQARIVDTYNNLTLKTMSILEWVNTYCSQVPFVLKTDDDVFINIPLLLKQLEQLQLTKRSIFGNLAHEGRPIREVNSKYFLSKSEYEPDIFPDYITGAAYLMTQDSVTDLYHQALQMHYLKLEDVLLTGIVAERIGIQRIHVDEFINSRIDFYDPQICNAISIHGITPSEQSWYCTYVARKRPEPLFYILSGITNMCNFNETEEM